MERFIKHIRDKMDERFDDSISVVEERRIVIGSMFGTG